MKIILCGCGSHILVDDEDLNQVEKYYWNCNSSGNLLTTRDNNGLTYISTSLTSLILDVPFGKEPDHIDGDIHNNQKSNLRCITHAENCRNRKLNENSSTGYKGVSWNKKLSKFQARITINGKTKSLGYFLTKEKAAVAYNDAATILHGEFARLNQLPNNSTPNQD